jgi:hypothetical protein
MIRGLRICVSRSLSRDGREKEGLPFRAQPLFVSASVKLPNRASQYHGDGGIRGVSAEKASRWRKRRAIRRVPRRSLSVAKGRGRVLISRPLDPEPGGSLATWTECGTFATLIVSREHVPRQHMHQMLIEHSAGPESLSHTLCT